MKPFNLQEARLHTAGWLQGNSVLLPLNTGHWSLTAAMARPQRESGTRPVPAPFYRPYSKIVRL